MPTKSTTQRKAAPRKAAPRKPEAQTPPQKDTITLTMEVTPELHAQIECAAALNGFTVNEWLQDIIENSV